MLSSQRKEITSSLKVNHKVYVIIGIGLFSGLNGTVASAEFDSWCTWV